MIVSNAIRIYFAREYLYRGGSELSASYWSFLDCIARARVEWGYVRRGQRWKRKGMDGTREEEAADMVGRATVVLGRCIVGVLAFNLTAQFH